MFITLETTISQEPDRVGPTLCIEKLVL